MADETKPTQPAVPTAKAAEKPVDQKDAEGNPVIDPESGKADANVSPNPLDRTMETEATKAEKHYVVLATMFGLHHAHGDVLPASELGGDDVIALRVKNHTIAEVGSPLANIAQQERAMSDAAMRRAGIE